MSKAGEIKPLENQDILFELEEQILYQELI